MKKEKLRFRDIWNRWYTWVLMLTLVLFDPLSPNTRDEEIQTWVQFFQQTGDEAGLYCVNEFPGLFLDIGKADIGTFIANLLIAFVTLVIVYAIINRFRKTK